jgi:hypothetical protein
VLDHVGIRVSDFEQSKRFFAQALSPLGYELIREPSVSAAGFGRQGKPEFWIHQGDRGQPVHIAFAASDRASVDAFHEEALAAGFAPSTIRATMGPSSSILMATTSKRSAMSQEKKPKPSSSYSPECVEGEFSEVHLQAATSAS